MREELQFKKCNKKLSVSVGVSEYPVQMALLSYAKKETSLRENFVTWTT